MKAYTDLEQSKVLAKILPAEGVDMLWEQHYNNEPIVTIKPWNTTGKSIGAHVRPCWSLSALLNYLREIDFFPNIEADEHSVIMSISYYNEKEARPLAPIHGIKVEADTFVDACYELILKLNKLNML